jgi:hypothetical protein
VDVIIARADLVAWTLELPAGAGKVLEQLLFDVDVNPWMAILGTENNVEQDIGQGLSHDVAPSGLDVVNVDCTQGVALGYQISLFQSSRNDLLSIL